jgi:hypothetical protein
LGKPPPAEGTSRVMATFSKMIGWGALAAVSVEANLRQQVKRSGRSQKSPTKECGSALLWELKA